ncbi:MAG: AAA family ATPase [Desulfobulbaceae bacterium]|nr:AAA family ATPase [Desulfobulbaceae bacterium]
MTNKKSNDNILSVRLAIRDRDVIVKLEKIISELDFCFLQTDKKAGQVDILILEAGKNPETECQTIKSLLDDGVVSVVFLTSSKATPDILVPALRIGARDFFQQPINEQEVKDALKQVYQGNGSSKHSTETIESQDPGKTYCVLGAKGGVGSTTFAVNLAVSLTQTYKKKRVALIDMNRLIGEVPIFLDLQTTFHWEQLTKNINRLDSTYLRRALVQHGSGVYVMPAPDNMSEGGDLSASVMLEVIEKTRKAFDYIVIDLGSHLDNMSFRLFNKADKVFVISILSLPCLVNVKRILESLRDNDRVRDGIIKIIANRFEKKNAISLEEGEQVIGEKFYYTIPNDYQSTMEAINAGKPLMDVARKSKVEKSYYELALQVNGGAEIGKKQKRGWFW